MVHYWIPEVTPTGAVTWAEVFEKMEAAKKEFNIEDYSVAQTTLEQIFLNFARAQKEENNQ